MPANRHGQAITPRLPLRTNWGNDRPSAWSDFDVRRIKTFKLVP